MNPLARQKLVALIQQHGPDLASDWKKCRKLLKAECPDCEDEIDILVEAVRSEMVLELQTMPPGTDPVPLIDRLAQQLQDDHDLAPEQARWAVESWAVALGVVPAPADPETPPPPPSEHAGELALSREDPTPSPPTPLPRKAGGEGSKAPPSPPGFAGGEGRGEGGIGALAEGRAPSRPTPLPLKAGGEGGTAGFDIEQRGYFYLGREYDLASRKVLDRPVMYDSRDLLTHGVVVGMTGSGKTGLCINLLEEAAMDGIPCIIIDPKGDLANLLLQFPDLSPDEFLPWLNPEDARLKGVPLEKYAEQLSERWRKGLIETGQSPERIAKLKDACEWRIYTPGSEAGLPLSLLQNFAGPKGKVPREELNQKIDATVTALLGLTGISADPVQSREHILIAQLLLNAWSKGRDLDLARLITQVREPPLVNIGSLEVDEFFPQRERMKLAVALNNILASPSFSTWITGDPLNLEAILSGGKKPRHVVFYVAHLDDAQRMFFITLLLEEILSWTRRQAGTTSLRAIVYFDEVYGYLPPHPANPPTKAPIMTLFKQARAFGVGVLIATQNPVDLDYKALSNAGTWFVGKLQTERDKARLIEGLEGVAAERGTLSDKAYLERAISALGNRVFLLHNVHHGEPVLFQSRWAMSFLRGPMTRDQIGELMRETKERELPSTKPDEREGEETTGTPAAVPLAAEGGVATEGEAVPAPVAIPAGTGAPAIAKVAQFYLPLSNPVRPQGATLVYQPRLLAFAEVVFRQKGKGGAEYRETFRCLVPPPGASGLVRWDGAEPCPERFAAAPEPGATWGEVPEAANNAKKIASLKKAFQEHLYTSARKRIWVNRDLGITGEQEAEFREKCRREAEEQKRDAIQAARLRFEPKFKALGVPFPDDQVPREEAGSILNPLSWLSMGQPDPEAHLTEKQKEKLGAARADWKEKRDEIVREWDLAAVAVEEVPLAPAKKDVTVTQFGLAWVPCWSLATAGGRVQEIPAYR